MFHSHSAAFQTDYLLQSSSRLAPHVGSPIITLSFAGADLPTHSRVRRLFVFAPLRGRSARNYSKPTCCTPTYIQAFTSSHRRLCKARILNYSVQPASSPLLLNMITAAIDLN